MPVVQKVIYVLWWRVVKGMEKKKGNCIVQCAQPVQYEPIQSPRPRVTEAKGVTLLIMRTIAAGMLECGERIRG